MQSFTKYPHRHVAPGTPQQRPSPPADTTMYPWQFVNDGQSSQATPPLQQSTGNEFVAPSYMSDGRRTPGPPTEPYLGSFAVSDGQGYNRNNYYVPQNEASPDVVDSSMHILPRGVAPTHPSATLPTQQTSLPQIFTGRSGDSSAAFSRTSSFRGTGTSPTRGPARPGRTQKGRGRGGRGGRGGRAGRASGARRSSNTNGSPGIEQWQNCHGQTGPPTLKADTPSLQRMIYDLRWQYRDHKGEDLWTRIQQDVLGRTGTKMNVSALQMKYARSRISYIEWLEQDASTRSLNPTASVADHLCLESSPLAGLA
jgi:hypothetical protein